MQECACIIQSNGLGKQAAKGACQHAGNEGARVGAWFTGQQAGKGVRVGAWWTCGVGCRLEGTWGDERALEQTTKRVAREASEGVVRVAC